MRVPPNNAANECVCLLGDPQSLPQFVSLELMKVVVREKGVLCTMGKRVAGSGATATYQPDFAIQVDKASSPLTPPQPQGLPSKGKEFRL